MTYAFQRGAALFAAAMIGVAACGGVAVIDGDNGNAGGAGGAASSNNSVSNASQTSSSAMSSSSSGMQDMLCNSACNSLDECGGGLPNCLARCVERSQGPCGTIHQDWMSCSLGETNTMCGFGPGLICGPLLQEYLSCTSEVAGELGCVGGPAFCECELFVSPGIEIGQICNGDNLCECTVGGEVVGFCPDPQVPSCEVLGGCCAGVLFTGGI